MKIEYCRDYEEMSRASFESFYSGLKISPRTSICAASGNSPTGFYEKMVANYQEQSELYYAMQVVKLDEWFGVSADDPNSCEHYIQNKIILPLNITSICIKLPCKKLYVISVHGLYVTRTPNHKIPRCIWENLGCFSSSKRSYCRDHTGYADR